MTDHKTIIETKNFIENQDRLYESDFDRLLKETESSQKEDGGK